MTSFLDQHYRACMKRGVDHSVYVVANDLSKEMGDKLRERYERYLEQERRTEDDVINLGLAPHKVTRVEVPLDG